MSAEISDQEIGQKLQIAAREKMEELMAVIKSAIAAGLDVNCLMDLSDPNNPKYGVGIFRISRFD